MAVAFKGNPVKLSGTGVQAGQPAPDFAVVGNDLSAKKLSDFKGKVVILSAVPSLDTGVCDRETRRFNEEAGKLGGKVTVLTISKDLPFAQKRWCGAAGVQNVVTLSDFRGGSFGKAYGLELLDSPLAGLLARAVVVVDKDGMVRFVEVVPEITQEPNYDIILAEAKKLV